MEFNVKEAEVLLVEEIPEPYKSLMSYFGPMTRQDADDALEFLAMLAGCEVKDIRYIGERRDAVHV